MLTKKLVASQMKDKNLNTVEKNIAKVLQADLNEMTKTLKDINISISKQENLNDTLRNVTNYINNLHAMHAKL
jgi:endonuclease III